MTDIVGTFSPAQTVVTALPPEYEAIYSDLITGGTSANTVAAYRSDHCYISTWKRMTLGLELYFPEDEPTVLQFVLDHTIDLENVAASNPVRQVAEAMIALGVRRKLSAPRAATLDRRISTWRNLHVWRGLAGPFREPSIAFALRKARRKAGGKKRGRKSANAITADVLADLLAVAGDGLTGLRNRALLQFAFASGGRRRCEVADLHFEDLDLTRFDRDGFVLIRLRRTKTSGDDAPPPLVLKHKAARDFVAWIDAARIDQGPVFRWISRPGRCFDGHVLERGISAGRVNQIVCDLLERAGYPRGFATAHGLRSGFLTEAARRGVPIVAAMQASQHRSIEQAARYYNEGAVERSIAADMLAPDYVGPGRVRQIEGLSFSFETTYEAPLAALPSRRFRSRRE